MGGSTGVRNYLLLVENRNFGVSSDGPQDKPSETRRLLNGQYGHCLLCDRPVFSVPILTLINLPNLRKKCHKKKCKKV